MMLMTELFNTKMSEFQQQLQQTSSSTSASVAADFTAFRMFIMSALETIQKQVEFLGSEIDRLEMRGRRKILLLHGVSEKKTEDTSSVVASIVSNKLKVPDFSTDFISRCHRIGRPSENKSRPLLVKLRDAAVRNKVWFAKTKLKGTGITISEFLTKSRHRIFMEARSRFGITNCWTRDGCIHVLGADSSVYKVESLADLDNIPTAPTLSSPVPPSAQVRPNDPKLMQRPKRNIKK